MTRTPSNPPQLSLTMQRRVNSVTREAFELQRRKFMHRRAATVEALRMKPWRLPEFQIAELLGVSMALLRRDYPKGGRE